MSRERRRHPLALEFDNRMMDTERNLELKLTQTRADFCVISGSKTVFDMRTIATVGHKSIVRFTLEDPDFLSNQVMKEAAMKIRLAADDTKNQHLNFITNTLS